MGQKYDWKKERERAGGRMRVGKCAVKVYALESQQ